MGIAKYKYYFSKPKSEIVKDVLTGLFVGGAIVLASTSPYFVQNLVKGYKRYRKYPKRKISAAFWRLKRDGFIDIRTYNNQVYISLTPDGRRKAGIFQINNLKIKKPKQWDKKWRLFMFDIPQKRKILREALRGKLKELGFLPFQKSIWILPFDCSAEIELLKDFFGLSAKEMQLIIVEDIGDDSVLQRRFKLSI